MLLSGKYNNSADLARGFRDQGALGAAAAMDEAFSEAAAVKGFTLPNPPVGAVLVKNGKIIGRGGTRPAGQAHAEVVALEKARGDARGATLYVTLEPCDHHGRTPPCTRALIEAGVSKVVAACADPNPKVSGRGFTTLRRAGIAVETGLQRDREKAEAFYAGFFFWIRHGRPLIVLKIAQSLDGRINAAPGQETALTGPETRAFAHSLRASADAILIGGKTLRVDNPDLTPRLAGGNPPQVLVLSGRRSLDLSAKVFARKRRTATVILSPHAPRNIPAWVEHALLPGHKALVPGLLGVFRERGYHEVLVEGGRGVWTPFLNAGLCDILNVVTAPVWHPRGEPWGKDLRPAWAKPLEFHRFTPLGPDSLVEFRRRLSAR